MLRSTNKLNTKVSNMDVTSVITRHHGRDLLRFAFKRNTRNPNMKVFNATEKHIHKLYSFGMI